MKDLYKILSDLTIYYEEVEHPAAHTVAEAQGIKELIDGVGCKNLFLTDHKKEKFLLVILEESKKADITAISHLAGMPHLHFADPDDLLRILGLIPGSVTPFGIINDVHNQVSILLDDELVNQKLLFHPNVNTKTISIQYDDFLRFLEYEQHSCTLVKIA